MGKKRKKSVAPSAAQQTEIQAAIAPEAVASQPAITEEKAAEIVAAMESAPVVIEPPKVIAKVEEPKIVIEAPIVSAPTPAPTAGPMIAITEATPTPIAAAEAEDDETPAVSAASPPESVDTAPMSSEAAPATARPKKKRKKRTTKPPVSREALDQKIGRLEAKLEEKKDAAAKAAREGFGAKADEDDTSVPPVDLEVHDAFFAAGEKDHAPTKESGSFGAVDLRHAQKMSASAHARRAHLSRYVKWSVGAAASILMLGFAIKTFRGHPNDEPVRKEVTHVAAPVETATQQVAQAKVDPPPVVELKDDTKTDDKKDDTALAGDAKAPEAVATDEAAKKDDLPPEKPKNAWQEKQAAKAALERGSNGVAIQAGERSVALDPSDGEAWLVLGGAYQAMGNNGQAKRCYTACTTQGKKGPLSDCKDMLGGL
ncbi:MAG TPA: hypothetical protein VGH87_24760 [Polyangiaceae bacterium]|jgi:tetratricopeptide (TPR) repeat protein